MARLLSALIFLSLLASANSRSNGSPHCQAGRAMIRTNHGTERKGKLPAGNYSLRNAAGETLISDFTVPIVLSTAVDNKITLKAGSSTDDFKGFMFRLNGLNGENAGGMLEMASSSTTDGKLLTWCDADVSGVTHTNASFKNSVDVIIRHDEPIELLRLEITVVKARVDWYFESFYFKLEAPPPVAPPSSNPTTAPTYTPTSAPTTSPTRTPTSVPTTSPTYTPTSVPTTAPTYTPTSVPTTSPTHTPTSVPTISPTPSPTSTPIFAPSPAPSTSNPTFAPTPNPSSPPTSDATLFAFCSDSPLMFMVQGIPRCCKWVARNPTERCNEMWGKGAGLDISIKTHCPETCQSCREVGCSDTVGRFIVDDHENIECCWLDSLSRSHKDELCFEDRIHSACPETCDFCYDYYE